MGGRATRTVFYEHTVHRIAYTVVSGSELKRPAGGRPVRRNGIAITPGHVMHRCTLLKLAAWRGPGAVHF
jgi:hypothetical protein